MTQHPVQRFISRFEKDNEFSYVEIPFVVGPSLEELQDICGFERDDLMYEEVELDDEKLQKLRRFVASDFDTSQYIYYLSCVDDAAE
ncbi:hypothetical protein QZM18_31250 [Burkholderia diffusa]|jgi:hypothetical protein|uniref:DUF7683 domain-containing protein n=1 Tax=Burkholderia TaxID=32008 RepID=UPI000756FE4D|nr:MULTISPECIES: hypothetical protein [Burkholderia]KVF75548.1 hypothetical protein WS75_14660 [Burkholderia sp. FL-7-2-10-S1-D7]MDN7908566.1 hypothetical protein [Burkholderia diffusa]RQR70886.1 hypothetical protein DIE11_30455 [Burkholderia sp. Bp9012]